MSERDSEKESKRPTHCTCPPHEQFSPFPTGTDDGPCDWCVRNERGRR